MMPEHSDTPKDWLDSLAELEPKVLTRPFAAIRTWLTKHTGAETTKEGMVDARKLHSAIDTIPVSKRNAIIELLESGGSDAKALAQLMREARSGKVSRTTLQNLPPVTQVEKPIVDVPAPEPVSEAVSAAPVLTKNARETAAENSIPPEFVEQARETAKYYVDAAREEIKHMVSMGSEFPADLVVSLENLGLVIEYQDANQQKHLVTDKSSTSTKLLITNIPSANQFYGQTHKGSFKITLPIEKIDAFWAAEAIISNITSTSPQKDSADDHTIFDQRSLSIARAAYFLREIPILRTSQTSDGLARNSTEFWEAIRQNEFLEALTSCHLGASPPVSDTEAAFRLRIFAFTVLENAYMQPGNVSLREASGKACKDISENMQVFNHLGKRWFNQYESSTSKTTKKSPESPESDWPKEYCTLDETFKFTTALWPKIAKALDGYEVPKNPKDYNARWEPTGILFELKNTITDAGLWHAADRNKAVRMDTYLNGIPAYVMILHPQTPPPRVSDGNHVCATVLEQANGQQRECVHVTMDALPRQAEKRVTQTWQTLSYVGALVDMKQTCEEAEARTVHMPINDKETHRKAEWWMLRKTFAQMLAANQLSENVFENNLLSYLKHTHDLYKTSGTTSVEQTANCLTNAPEIFWNMMSELQEKLDIQEVCSEAELHERIMFQVRAICARSAYTLDADKMDAGKAVDTIVALHETLARKHNMTLVQAVGKVVTAAKKEIAARKPKPAAEPNVTEVKEGKERVADKMRKYYVSAAKNVIQRTKNKLDANRQGTQDFVLSKIDNVVFVPSEHRSSQEYSVTKQAIRVLANGDLEIACDMDSPAHLPNTEWAGIELASIILSRNSSLNPSYAFLASSQDYRLLLCSQEDVFTSIEAETLMELGKLEPHILAKPEQWLASGEEILTKTCAMQPLHRTERLLQLQSILFRFLRQSADVRALPDEETKQKELVRLAAVLMEQLERLVPKGEAPKKAEKEPVPQSPTPPATPPSAPSTPTQTPTPPKSELERALEGNDKLGAPTLAKQMLFGAIIYAKRLEKPEAVVDANAIWENVKQATGKEARTDLGSFALRCTELCRELETEFTTNPPTPSENWQADVRNATRKIVNAFMSDKTLRKWNVPPADRSAAFSLFCANIMRLSEALQARLVPRQSGINQVQQAVCYTLMRDVCLQNMTLAPALSRVAQKTREHFQNPPARWGDIRWNGTQISAERFRDIQSLYGTAVGNGCSSFPVDPTREAEQLQAVQNVLQAVTAHTPRPNTDRLYRECLAGKATYVIHTTHGKLTLRSVSSLRQKYDLAYTKERNVQLVLETTADRSSLLVCPNVDAVSAAHEVLPHIPEPTRPTENEKNTRREISNRVPALHQRMMDIIRLQCPMLLAHPELMERLEIAEEGNDIRMTVPAHRANALTALLGLPAIPDPYATNTAEVVENHMYHTFTLPNINDKMRELGWAVREPLPPETQPKKKPKDAAASASNERKEIPPQALALEPAISDRLHLFLGMLLKHGQQVWAHPEHELERNENEVFPEISVLEGSKILIVCPTIGMSFVLSAAGGSVDSYLGTLKPSELSLSSKLERTYLSEDDAAAVQSLDTILNTYKNTNPGLLPLGRDYYVEELRAGTDKALDALIVDLENVAKTSGKNVEQLNTTDFSNIASGDMHFKLGGVCHGSTFLHRAYRALSHGNEHAGELLPEKKLSSTVTVLKTMALQRKRMQDVLRDT